MKTKIRIRSFEKMAKSILAPYSGTPLKLIISGGSILGVLASPEVGSLDKSMWSIYFADERYVPNTDPENNFFSAGEFLKHVGEVFPINTELPIEESKDVYQGILKRAFFDLAILGVGEDGHIASIFPESSVIESSELVAVVQNSPKLPASRITVTPRLLSLVKQIVFMILPFPDGRPKGIEEPHFSIISKIPTKITILLPERE
jgi:6-phosphogluconolactonase